MAYRDFPFSHLANKEKRKMRRVIVAICSYYIYALQFFFFVEIRTYLTDMLL